MLILYRDTLYYYIYIYILFIYIYISIYFFIYIIFMYILYMRVCYLYLLVEMIAIDDPPGHRASMVVGGPKTVLPCHFQL